MGLPFREVKLTKKQFEEEYFFAKPWKEFVNSCGISKVGTKDKFAPIDEQGDWCISVGLRKSLPPGLSLPTEYQGVKVFAEVIGEIRLL